jgi:hypothetical protein
VRDTRVINPPERKTSTEAAKHHTEFPPLSACTDNRCMP